MSAGSHVFYVRAPRTQKVGRTRISLHTAHGDSTPSGSAADSCRSTAGAARADLRPRGSQSSEFSCGCPRRERMVQAWCERAQTHMCRGASLSPVRRVGARGPSQGLQAYMVWCGGGGHALCRCDVAASLISASRDTSSCESFPSCRPWPGRAAASSFQRAERVPAVACLRCRCSSQVR